MAATPSDDQTPRDAGHWATGSAPLSLSGVPPGALNLNVEGRRVVGPIQGFGKLWQKTYRVRLAGGPTNPNPAELIATWKARFPDFWPSGNRFYAPITGIAPGEVALINLAMPGRVKLSTGVLVLYADEESFTLMTPQGHIFAGWITFSAFAGSREGETVAQAQILMRANDPLYEIGLGLGGHRQENRFWEQTLRALAAHFGVAADVETRSVCVDGRRQWWRVGNLRHNAGVRSGLYALAAPLRRSAPPLPPEAPPVRHD